MSKSVGNFITLDEAVAGSRSFSLEGGPTIKVGWSADATRLALANAGDNLDDANFSCDDADKSILRLTNELDWAAEVVAPVAAAEQRSGPRDEYSFFERAFDAAIDAAVVRAAAAYEAMRFRDVATFGMYKLMNERDQYRDVCSLLEVPMHGDLVRRYLETMCVVMSPICPHFYEHMWTDVLGKEGLVAHAAWPEVPAGRPDEGFVSSVEFLMKTIDAVRTKRRREHENRKKKKTANAEEAINSVTLHVADTFPAVHGSIVAVLTEQYDEAANAFPADIMRQLKATVPKSDAKAALKVAAELVRRVTVDGEGAAALQLEVPFDQVKLLQDNMAYAKLAMSKGGEPMDVINIVLVEGEDVAAKPGNVRVSFP